MIVQVQSELERFALDVYFHNPASGYMLAAETRASYLESVRLFDRYVRAAYGFRLPLAEFTVELFGGFLTWLVEDQGDSPSTADKHRRQLVPILRLARERGFVSVDPDAILQAKQLKRLPQSWSADELVRVVQTAMRLDGSVGPWPARHWFPALMLTIYSTGWRISANMALRTCDVSLERGFAVSIEKKTQQERFAQLLPEAVVALGKIWDPRRREVFGDWPYDRGGRQWKALNKRLAKLISAAGAPDIGRWHAIRKTAITLTVAGSDLETARRFAGHSNSRVTTDHYVDPRHLPRVQPVLPAISPPSSERQLDLF